jgi:hypothetical protein
LAVQDSTRRPSWSRVSPVLDLVHLRMTGTLEPDGIVEPFTVLAELQQQRLATLRPSERGLPWG